MFDLLIAYWPHILAVLSAVLGAVAAVHAAMTKDEVRAAVGWVGVILLSPIVGALLYAIAGINRIRRASIASQRSLIEGGMLGHLAGFVVPAATVETEFGARFVSMKTLGDRVARYPLTSANKIEILDSGDKAYSAMIAAIASARRSILLETYIFDRDGIGLRVADALIAASRRGVEVRVLVDAVGARYSVPSIIGYLKAGGVAADVFNGNVIMGLRLPYANLRTHRKLMIVDGTVAFTGGMNIRAGFTSEFASDKCAHDTHFCVSGPVVADLISVAGEDWRFTTGEALDDDKWQIALPPSGAGSAIFIRAVATGPDRSVETNHKMLMGAFSVAKRSIRIMSPYFLPDRELITALVTASRRGVDVDIVVPSVNNLTLVDRAMTSQFDQMLRDDCRIWRAKGAFNHSKLMAVDGSWAYVGSSNLDPRSLRLNFEIDLEVMDRQFAGEIDARIRQAVEGATAVTLDSLYARPFAVRLLDRAFWLGSPYL